MDPEPTSRFPGYDHDPDKYKAICRWLGINHLPEPPLTKLIYDEAAPALSETHKGWEFDSTRAAMLFIAAARKLGVATGKPLQPRAYGNYLRHLFRGMQNACNAGYNEPPACCGFTKEDLGVTGLTTIAPDGAGNLIMVFHNVPKLAEDLDGYGNWTHSQTIHERRKANNFFRNCEMDGFAMQSMAHLLKTEPFLSYDEVSDATHDAFARWQETRHHQPTIDR